MPDTQQTNIDKAPWHLWVVGLLGLLWSAGGAFDYFMTQTSNEAYMSAFTPEQLEFFYGLPSWVVAFWALAVWGGVLGAILLLLRKAIAVKIFLISLIAFLITAFQNYGLSNGLEVIGDAFSLVFVLVIFLASLGLFFYSRAMLRRGVIG
ncbi:MAG: hypothetical protein HKN85_07525 [Gammaproteobacteria bacterium]|nr:hypothetical protein [Gammaproteobacteria bacterium]